jgi:hypothetical protein
MRMSACPRSLHGGCVEARFAFRANGLAGGAVPVGRGPMLRGGARLLRQRGMRRGLPALLLQRGRA